MEPEIEDIKLFVDVYKRALEDVLKESEKMMFSRSKRIREEGLEVYSTVKDYINQLENNPEDFEKILQRPYCRGALHLVEKNPTFEFIPNRQIITIDEIIRERIEREAYLTRNSKTALQEVLKELRRFNEIYERKGAESYLYRVHKR
jgi:hypothetical protein